MGEPSSIQDVDNPPSFCKPWKAIMAIIVLANFRSLFGNWALVYLHRRALEEPEASAFLFLGLLKRGNDPAFKWHLLYLLRRVPESAFQNQWVSLRLSIFDGIPGVTFTERVALFERMFFRAFNLGTASKQAHLATSKTIQ
jgi:hypothetical protein